MVKEGSIWQGNGNEEFTVLHRVELEGKIWIHYRNQAGTEFSCYEDAFEARFREYSNDKRRI